MRATPRNFYGHRYPLRKLLVTTNPQYAAAIRTESRLEALQQLDIPTLVVHGENDTLLSPEHGRRTAELIPGAEYLEIEGFSHDFVYQVWPPLIEATTALTARTFG